MIQYHCYENLANAIVADAAKEYRKALKVLKVDPKDKEARRNKREAKEFFFSSWFEILTDLRSRLSARSALLGYAERCPLGTRGLANLMSLCRSCHNKIHHEMGDR